MTRESPIRMCDGLSVRKSPFPSKACFRNSTSLAGSSTTSRGVMLCQPTGIPLAISSPSSSFDMIDHEDLGGMLPFFPCQIQDAAIHPARQHERQAGYRVFIKKHRSSLKPLGGDY